MAFGRTDVNAFLDELTERQFLEWVAFDRISPIGLERVDIAIGRACMLLARSMGAKKDGGVPFDEFDFVPWIQRPAPKSPEDMTPEEYESTAMVQIEKLRQITLMQR